MVATNFGLYALIWALEAGIFKVFHEGMNYSRAAHQHCNSQQLVNNDAHTDETTALIASTHSDHDEVHYKGINSPVRFWCLFSSILASYVLVSMNNAVSSDLWLTSDMFILTHSF